VVFNDGALLHLTIPAQRQHQDLVQERLQPGLARVQKLGEATLLYLPMAHGRNRDASGLSNLKQQPGAVYGPESCHTTHSPDPDARDGG
jgi:hypothetical protein